jgi:hypothetical protein
MPGGCQPRTEPAAAPQQPAAPGARALPHGARPSQRQPHEPDPSPASAEGTVNGGCGGGNVAGHALNAAWLRQQQGGSREHDRDPAERACLPGRRRGYQHIAVARKPLPRQLSLRGWGGPRQQRPGASQRGAAVGVRGAGLRRIKPASQALQGDWRPNPSRWCMISPVLRGEGAQGSTGPQGAQGC